MKEGSHMLSPVTKNYEDKSTIEYFEFTFYCDCCGTPLTTKKKNSIAVFYQS